MNSTRRTALQGLAIASLFPLSQPAFSATDFPNRPIRIIVPFPAGGILDTLVRNVSNAAAPDLGQAIVIENKPGVGGSLGAEMVAKSKPDGYTLLGTFTGSLAITAALFSKLKYDPGKDLACITELATTRSLLVVNAELPIHSVKELVAYSKQHPGKVSIAGWGPGSPGHTAQVLLNNKFGADLLHVPYKGESQITTDLMSNQVSLAILSPMALKAQMSSGRLRPIATFGVAKVPMFEHIPSMADQGFKEPAWSTDGPFAIFGPLGLDAEVTDRLSRSFNKALSHPKVQTFANEAGIYIKGNTPLEAQQNYASYFTVVKKIVEDTGAKLD